jgi:hypothetical protein
MHSKKAGNLNSDWHTFSSVLTGYVQHCTSKGKQPYREHTRAEAWFALKILEIPDSGYKQLRVRDPNIYHTSIYIEPTNRLMTKKFLHGFLVF